MKKNKEDECLNCASILEQIPHKRKKQFCNSTCRSNYWQKQKRKATDKPLATQPKVAKKKSQPKKTFSKTEQKIKQKSTAVEVQVVSMEIKKHRLWQAGDPPEGSNAFFLRKGAFTYDEMEKNLKTKKQ
jgi:hypothetical protein